MATKEQQLKANGVTASQVSDIEALFKNPSTTSAPAASTGSTGSASAPAGGDSFLQALQAKLLSQSDMISSQDTNIEKSIGDAIAGLQSSKESSGQSIEKGFDRAIGYAREDQTNTLIQGQERQRGNAVNVAALRELVSTTDKQINDLESRKQEALLANDATAAAKISDLQMQAMEFKQKSYQTTFTNLLSMGNFAMQGEQMAEQKRQFNVSQSFEERSTIANIGLQFGVAVKEGDTIDSISARVAPFASERQKLEIQKLKAEIGRANAEARKALQGESNTTDALTISLLAQAANTNPALLGLIKDPKQAAAVILSMQKMNEPRDFSSDELTGLISNFKSSGQSSNAVKAEIAKDAKVKNKDAAYAAVDQVYGSQGSTQGQFKSGALNMGANIGVGILNGIGSVNEFLYGSRGGQDFSNKK